METLPNTGVLEFLQNRIGKQLHYPSAFGSWMGGVLLDAERGYLQVEYTVREEMTNAAKTFHGGAIAAILDDLMGLTVASLGLENFFVTLNLSVDYLSGAQIGERIVVSTKVNREGRNIVNVESTMVNAQGKLLAKATSNLAKSQMPRVAY